MIKEKIKILKQSKEVRTLFENFTSLTILQIIGYAFPLLTLPYLSSVIGVSKFGILAFANAIVSYVATITFFGFQYTAVRDISRNKFDEGELNKIVSNVVFSMLLLFFITSIVILILIFSFQYFTDYRIIIILTLLNIPAQIINFDWFFQGIEKMRYFTILTFISKLIYTISIFFVIKSIEDYVLVPILLAISTFISGIYAIFLVFVLHKVKIKFPGLRNIMETFKSGWSVFVSQIAPNFYNSILPIVLNSYFGVVSLGIYDAGRKVVSISEQLPIIFSKSSFPYLSRRIDKHNHFIKVNMILSISITCFTFLFADWIVNILYTPAFNRSIWVIRIMSFTPIAFSLVNGYGINYLVQMGMERVFRNIILICSICGFVLLFILIPRYNIYGASITVVSIYFVQGFLCRYYALKHKKRIIND